RSSCSIPHRCVSLPTPALAATNREVPRFHDIASSRRRNCAEPVNLRKCEADRISSRHIALSAGAFHSQEAPMQRDQDKWKPAGRSGISDQITSIVVINGVIVLALIVLALSSPSASEWISAAVQAEFVGSDAPATSPTQIAQPV